MVWHCALRDGEPSLTGIAFRREDEPGLCLVAADSSSAVRLLCAPLGSPDAPLESRSAASQQSRQEGALSSRVLLPASNKCRGARCMALAPQSRCIAAGHEDGAVWLRSAAPNTTGRQKRRALKSRAASVNALAFSPDETLLAGGFGDGVVVLWPVADAGGERRTLTFEEHCGVTALAFSPDGATLAMGGDNGAVGVWDIASGRNVWTQTRHEFWVRALAFAPNSRALASGGYDGVVRVWATQSGVELQTLAGHEESISALAFAPDDRTLVSSGLDETVKTWDSWTGTPHHTAATRAVVTAIAFQPVRSASAGAARPLHLALATAREIVLWHLDDPAQLRSWEWESGFTPPLDAIGT